MSNHYDTVLYKLSGELLGGKHGSGIDSAVTRSICEELANVSSSQTRVAVVVGGGNFFRGGQNSELNASAVRKHQIGMLFTLANALALEQTLLSLGAKAAVQSAIEVPALVDRYDGVSFQSHFDRGCVVIFAGGTGNTHFTTDTAASLRAIEIGADILLKATKVDGIYTVDPMSDKTAKRYELVSYDEVLEKNLAVMDATSVALCREHGLPIRVFDASKSGNIEQSGLGAELGTLVSKVTADDS